MTINTTPDLDISMLALSSSITSIEYAGVRLHASIKASVMILIHGPRD